PISFRWYLFLLAFLILPNLPLLLAAHPLNLLLHGTINLDYLLVGLVSLFIPRVVTFFLLLAAILLDFIHAVCITYLFSPAEFFHVMRYGGMLSTTRMGLILAVFGFSVLVCLASAGFTSRRLIGRQRRLAYVTMLAPFFLLALIDFRSARSILLPSGNEPSGARLTRTPTLGLLYSQVIYERYERGLRLGGQFAMPSATSLALNHLENYQKPDSFAGQSEKNNVQPNLVLVVVESWGLARDPSLRRAMTEPYSDSALLAKYDVLRGTMPFQGPTTSGEGRELCQSHMGAYVAQGTPEQLQRCLPMRLRRMGYRTLAVHGFNGEMYDRKNWYPKLGFEDIWFLDRLQAIGLPDCDGTFKGTCDDAIAAWLGDKLQQPGNAPLFVHWVTLNSHLPLWRPIQLKSPSSCSVSPITRNDPAVCSWYQLISVVSQSMRDLALKPQGRPTIFVIVGDHAPPFDRDFERSQFSATEVPFVILLPKSDTAR
ncbi:MAG TPA: sulfatase-like hydrolase/transferase, partial [Silvibacterium sp.]|nr:sulfatase-like hydrolase/transferase [Silvibacterium sp.]